MPRRRLTKSVCAAPGCPTLTLESRCPDHRLTDYGPAHRAHRAAQAPAVAAGLTTCARCGGPILPGQPWADDHDLDRTGYLGPSHADCNSGAHT